MPIESFLAIFGCVTFVVVNGGIFVWGTICIYVISYFRGCDESINYSLSLIMPPIRGLLGLILLPLGSYIDLKWGKRKSLLLGILIFIFSIFICVITDNYYIFSLFFGLAFASNNSIGISLITEVSWQYFPNNKGLANGIIYSGYLISSLISILTHYIVNWNDIHPQIIIKREMITEFYYEKEITDKVKIMLIFLWVIWSILLAISYFNVKYPSESYLKLIEEQSIKIDERRTRKKTVQLYHTSFKEALMSDKFIIIICINSLAFLMDFQFSLCFKELTLNFGYSDGFLTIIGSLFPAINSTSRILFSYLSDKNNPALLLGCMLLIQAISFGITPLFAGNKITFVIIVFIYSIASAGHGSIFNLIFIHLFGITMAGNLIAYLMGSSAIGHLFLFLFNYFLLPLIGYKMYYLALMVLLLASSKFMFNFQLNLIWRKRSIALESETDKIKNN